MYVTGSTFRDTLDYVTIAYGAADGTWAWTKRYDGRMDAIDDAAANAVSPDGSRVFVTGTSENARAAPTISRSPSIPRPVRRSGPSVTDLVMQALPR